VEVLSSRVLVRPSDLDRSIAFYRDQLGLKIYREYGTGSGTARGVVFFLGGGHLELSGVAPPATAGHEHVSLWLQVPDLRAAHRELAGRGVEIVEPPDRKPWGLLEMWITDPDGVRIVVVEVPDDHPLRRRVE
jgi:predicted enzyme related to lactoylglutathione lyase